MKFSNWYWLRSFDETFMNKPIRFDFFKHVWENCGYGVRSKRIQKTTSSNERKIQVCLRVWSRVSSEGYKAPRHVFTGTLWSVLNKDKSGNHFWEFNHLEDNYCPNAVPTPLHPNHIQAWKNQKWKKEFVTLMVNDSGIPVVVR